MVLVAQLLAFILVLAEPAGGERWQSLGLVSLFVQWIVLGSAALLCLLRTWLARWGMVGGALAAYALILLMALAVSGVGHWLFAPYAGTAVRIDFMLRSLTVTAIIAAVALRYLYVQHQWKRRLESEAAARIDALQARIRPHFLFNSLNTIASMIPQAPAQAEAAVEDLADLFRASLSRSDRLVPLRNELELARDYLQLEALRLGDRLKVEWATERLPEDALLPPMTLQPLLENAVYHGIEPHVQGGTVRISGAMESARLRLCLSNPLPPARHRRRSGLGMALDNTRQRIRLALGPKADLTALAEAGEYRVELVLPYVSKPDEDTDR
ncbi:sensor histidine kinase [Alkalilimnicola ehrlichii]|uniref:sensor histidine kinase n=1 Tax=Alkalilimnicola ehrlichii TaxID=351052 RepID=UPI002163DA40|nr:histidine kinase [Alkalilimnicola ehrlichii]